MSARVMMRFMAIGVFLVCGAAMQAQPRTSSNAHNSGATPTPIPRPTPHPRPLPPITVTNTNDSGPGSLRQVLADAHDGNLINFAAALNGQIITLTSAELVIDKNITINGPGPNTVTVSRPFSNPPFRIFHVMPGHNVAIQGLTISGGGMLGEVGGGILNDHATLTVSDCTVEFNGSAEVGGGICNDGSNGSATMTILNSTISGNTAPEAGGGGICNDGSNGSATLSILNSTISANFSPFAAGILNDSDQGTATLTMLDSLVNDNQSTGGNPPFNFGVAGGIANSGVMVITNSTISGNLASNDAGGILNDGTLTITSSTITGNQAGAFGGNVYPGYGGGISSDGPLTISNSTISGNTAAGNAFKGFGYGGGVGSSGTIAISNSTITGNWANIGGGIYNSGPFETGNTIFNAGASGENIVNDNGTVTSHGYNLSSDDGGCCLNGPGDQINTDPLLGPLQDNGGPALRMPFCPAVPQLTRAIQTLIHRLTTINAARVLFASSTAASMWVRLRCNRNRHHFLLQDHGRRQLHGQLHRRSQFRGRIGSARLSRFGLAGMCSVVFRFSS